jgi:hypothetical protein
MSIASLSLRISGLFEAELLLELMLRHWQHPLANDPDFRNLILENAAEALRSAVSGQQLFDDVPAKKTNLVAAIWYAEWSSVNTEHPGSQSDQILWASRKDWLDRVRRALPSCFCSPDLLP